MEGPGGGDTAQTERPGTLRSRAWEASGHSSGDLQPGHYIRPQLSAVNPWNWAHNNQLFPDTKCGDDVKLQ